MRTERWEETVRREVGIVTGEANHPGHRAVVYFALLYMVTECRKEGDKVVEWRERLESGATVYGHTQRDVATGALLKAVANGVEALSHIARVEDERILTARRATSRRKRR